MTEYLQIERRALLQGMALLLGATALPADAFAAPTSKGRRVLARSQFKVLEAVADTLVPNTDTPGAIAADVPARLDQMLRTWASEATRTSIVEALGRIDAAARQQTGKGFVDMAAPQRETFLRAHDAAALKTVPALPGYKPVIALLPQISVVDQGYYRIKELVLNLYYYSEIATSTELIYEHVPGEWQPSITLAPGQRPYLGPGIL